MFLENTFETAGLSAKLSYINLKKEKTYKLLKPAVKDAHKVMCEATIRLTDGEVFPAA